MAITIPSPTQNYSYCNELLLLISTSLLLLFGFNYRIRLGCTVYFFKGEDRKTMNPLRVVKVSDTIFYLLLSIIYAV